MNELPTVRRTVVITDKDPNGLHMRPAQMLVKLALGYKCKIEVVRETLRVDAKSIFDVMTLAAEPGAELVLEAQGDDAEPAIEELARYIENGFATDETQYQDPA
jgi:phosphocarrier protein HPr